MGEIIHEKFESANLRANFYFDKDNGIWGIIFMGSMDTEPAQELNKYLHEKCYVQRYNYIIDLELLEYMSSTGIGVLSNLENYKKEFVYFSKMHPEVEKTCKLIGIDRYWKFYEDLEDVGKYLMTLYRKCKP